MSAMRASRALAGAFALAALAASGANAGVTCVAVPSGSPYACATSSSSPLLSSRADVVNKTSFLASVGASAVNQVKVETNVGVKTGSGVVNIEPFSESASLTTITLTPLSGYAYDGLFFTEQATNVGGSWTGDLTAVVSYGASSSVTFTWSKLSADATYKIGFADTGPGSTPFTKVVLSLGSHGKFEHVEDLRLSAAAAAPELSTWALVAAGFAALGAVGGLRARRASLRSA